CRALRIIPHPQHGQSVRVVELSPAPTRILLKWELHGEFCAITLYFQQGFGIHETFADTRAACWMRLSDRLHEIGVRPWSAQAGQRMSAIDLVIQSAASTDDAARIAARFDGNTLIGSTILASQRAQVWTDFQTDDEGFIRFLVTHQGMGSRQAGRVAQRIIDMDTYRMMAMLAFPKAKALGESLRQAERELAQISADMAETLQAERTGQADVSTDERLLKGVSSLAARVEQWVSALGLRFTASEAYSELSRRAIQELREQAIPGVQTLTEFMDRRFEPAMRTCQWTRRRLSELSDRISRTTQILRTRIEFINERQTQSLLASMDRRAKLQLRLQQTVEGLSLVVLTYYGVGLVSAVVKGLKDVGAPLSPEIIGALSVPIIAGSLALGIRRARRKLTGEMTPEPPKHP
ncbi:MAG: DUF3422 family protein, partial [Burkholderiaceae bacterium]